MTSCNAISSDQEKTETPMQRMERLGCTECNQVVQLEMIVLENPRRLSCLAAVEYDDAQETI